MSSENTKKISVVGLGKLGAPLAAVMAQVGHEVWGMDLNPEAVKKINEGLAPVQEPQLQDFIAQSAGRLRATCDMAEAISATDITFVIVPTPSQQDGSFSNEYIVAALTAVGESLRAKTGYHLVVISSTVMPGSMDSEISEALAHASGKVIGSPDLGLCYNPEFIALGNVINNMQHPDFLLIGESDPRAGNLLESLHASVCQNTPAYHRMNFVNAEITKISVNTYVTTKISYANMLAEVCENLPGADVDVVTDAVGSDSRIGKKYLKGAIGYGGPCFPRDNKAFAVMAERLGAAGDIAVATDSINDRQVDRMVNIIGKHAAKGACVAVLGLAYKPDTPEVEQSQGIQLCERLKALGFDVYAHDPQANGYQLDGIATIADTSKAALARAETVIIVTPWQEYGAVSYTHL
ncbi:MAG: nucleotide sugar dehydrogenase, partial [Kordiimonadaceae bacterium]|nr:nucleotide sugar dehydrogenase [Kordiimonadaceae bacterium]